MFPPLLARRRFAAEMPLALAAAVIAGGAPPVTGAFAAPPSSKTVPASVKHLCSVIDPSFVLEAGVTAPCVQLKPLLGGKTFVACYAANWGSVLTEEGSDHALGVEVCLPRSPTFLAREKLALAHAIASGPRPRDEQRRLRRDDLRPGKDIRNGRGRAGRKVRRLRRRCGLHTRRIHLHCRAVRPLAHRPAFLPEHSSSTSSRSRRACAKRRSCPLA